MLGESKNFRFRSIYRTTPPQWGFFMGKDMKKLLLLCVYCLAMSGCIMPTAGQVVYKWNGTSWEVDKVIAEHDRGITTDSINWRIKQLNANAKPK
jgi:hypothetical protein